MTRLPVAQLVSIDWEPGLTRYDVLCPYCNAVHHHRWLGTDTRFALTAPCSCARRYRVDLSGFVAAGQPKRDVSQPHIVTPQPGGQSCRDDNAMHEYENNWTE